MPFAAHYHCGTAADAKADAEVAPNESETVYRQSISDSWLGNFKRMSGSSGLKVQAAIAC